MSPETGQPPSAPPTGAATGGSTVPEYTDARMKDYAAADQNRDGALTRNETAGK